MGKMKSWQWGTVALLLAAVSAFAQGGSALKPWKGLSEGVEYAVFDFQPTTLGGDGKLHVVRIDPGRAELALFLASEHGKRARTAGKWCDEFDLLVAVNAGMYQQDHLSNVGYLRNGNHRNNSRWHPTYQSVLAFGPRRSGLPAFTMVDLDIEDAGALPDDYDAVVQNLRLLKDPARNVWSRQERFWSEAAVGMDRKGRVLLLFTRTPLSMWGFNEVLKRLPLGIVQAMHAEGGPEASLSIRADNVSLDLAGSYETGFNPNHGNIRQWQIPNVLAVRRKTVNERENQAAAR